MEQKVVVEVEDEHENKFSNHHNGTETPELTQISATPSESLGSGIIEHTDDEDERRTLTSNTSVDTEKLTSRKNSLVHVCDEYCLGQFSTSHCLVKCCKSTPRKIFLFLVVSLSLNVVLIFGLCYMLLIWRNREPSEPASAAEHWSDIKESVCFPCDYLGEDVTNEDILYDLKTRCGHKFCCVKDAGLQKLVILIASKERGLVENPEANTAVNATLTKWRDAKVAAHLYLNTTALKVNKQIKFESKDIFGTAFTKGIGLVNGSLQVPKLGYYFVYSSVTFKVDKANKSPDANSMYHLISRKHPKLPRTGEQLLLLDKHGPISAEQKYTSFLCGVLKLRPGDEIQTNVSNASLVYNFALTNYMGLYLL